MPVFESWASLMGASLAISVVGFRENLELVGIAITVCAAANFALAISDRAQIPAAFPEQEINRSRC